MARVESMSAGAVRSAPGTMYGALENLEKQRLIARVASADARRKVYQVTELGYQTLTRDAERMAHLVSKAGPFYAFTPIEPGSAVVRVDYRPTMSAADFVDYVTLFADAGWRHLAGTRTSGTQYFASSAERADTEIFSDPTSRALCYRRALGVTGGIAALYLLLVFVLVVSGNGVFASLSSPGDWYLTPGPCGVMLATVAHQWRLYRRASAVDRTA